MYMHVCLRERGEEKEREGEREKEREGEICTLIDK